MSPLAPIRSHHCVVRPDMIGLQRAEVPRSSIFLVNVPSGVPDECVQVL